MPSVAPNVASLNGCTDTTQAAIIIPWPNNPDLYFIFTLDCDVEPDGLQYSIIDMTLEGGLGDVSNLNIPLRTPMTEKLTAVRSTSFNGYWVISHEWGNNNFVAYRVTSSGVDTTPVISSVGDVIDGSVSNAEGQMKVSPDGKLIGMATGGEINKLELFDFDTTTGEVSNPRTILDELSDTNIYGVEFSPSGDILYVSGLNNGVYQYDLTAGSLAEIIATQYEMTVLTRTYASMQLATDGKIYVVRDGMFSMDYIENPEVIGDQFNYVNNAIDLLGKRGARGLPPFIQSFFFVGFTFEQTCEGSATQFTSNISESYDTISWDFGDGNASSEENPMHTYVTAGTYTVTLTVTSGTETSQETKEVTIYEVPTVTQPTNITICDSDNDGFSSFNLMSQNSVILAGQDPSTFNITYYASMADYTNNNPIADSSNYTNLIAFTPQTIVASVKNTNNSDCEAITTFEIQVFESPTPSTTLAPLRTCDTDNDGFFSFDLAQQETAILNGQSPTDFEVTYYASQTDYDNNNPIADPNNYTNTTAITQNIVVSVRNVQNTLCETTTNFDIQVFESPTPSTSVSSILVCDDNNDGFFSFNLRDQDTAILNGQDPSIFTVTYFASQDDVDNNNPIPDPSNYINTTAYATQTIVASVQNNGNTECLATTTFEIQVFESPTPTTDIPLLAFCDNTSVGTDADGKIEFDLTQNQTAILNGQSTSDFNVNYFTDNGLTNQILNPSEYQNTNPNETIYVQVVNNQNTNCTAQTSFDIEVYELPEVTSIVELKQCDDDLDGFSVFNLTEVNAELSANYQNETIAFYESESEAESGSSPISNPTAYANETVSTDAVWARIENENSCYRTARVNLTISTTQIPTTLLREFYRCDDGTETTDGIATFDFSSVDTEIQALFPVGQQLIINYYRNQADALSEINPIADISNYQNIGYPNTQDERYPFLQTTIQHN